MDLSQLPENERNYMMKLIEEKQAKQFMSMYTTIVSKCFEGCVDDFTSDTPSSKEKDCIKKCTQKILKMTNRIGQQIAEKQMMPPS